MGGEQCLGFKFRQRYLLQLLGVGRVWREERHPVLLSGVNVKAVQPRVRLQRTHAHDSDVS